MGSIRNKKSGRLSWHICSKWYIIACRCIEIYELDSAHFLPAPRLEWQACLKKTKVNLELLADIDMLLMAEKGIRCGIFQAIHRHAKANNKYMKNYDKDIIYHHI